MNILFLVDPLHNYVSDPLYLGLVRVLGDEHVVDFPPKAIFHDPSAKLWFLPQVPAARRSEEEVRSLLAERSFDIVCLASPRAESLALLGQLFNPARFPPIVFIDSADDAKIRHDLVRRFPIRIYFKREYAWKRAGQIRQFVDCARSFRFDRKLFAKTYPFPMSIVVDAVPVRDVQVKDIDVSFYGHASHRKRVKAMHVLHKLAKDGLRVAGSIFAAPTDRKYKLQATPFRRLMTKILDPSYASDEDTKRKLSPAEYYDVLSRSKVAVSVRGGGFDTYRYWEIVACGSLLLSEAPDIVIPNNFEHEKHAVFCRPDLSDLEDLARYYIRHEDERQAIATNGYAHLLKHHTCERRAEYFLDICARMV